MSILPHQSYRGIFLILFACSSLSLQAQGSGEGQALAVMLVLSPIGIIGGMITFYVLKKVGNGNIFEDKFIRLITAIGIGILVCVVLFALLDKALSR